MTHIRLKDLSVNYPIFNGNSKFLKNLLFKKKSSFGSINSINDKSSILALNNLTLNFSPGDRVGIIGKNGSGKTTLLRTLAGVLKPSSGTISISGTLSSLIDISVGVNLDATGIDNIKIRSALMGYSLKNINKLITDIREFSELEDYLDLPCKYYSTGMMMRLYFALATTVDSEIVLLDEWLAVGDSVFESKAQERLLKFLNQSSIFIMASHNIDLIKNVCNRIIVLENGNLISDDHN